MRRMKILISSLLIFAGTFVGVAIPLGMLIPDGSALFLGALPTLVLIVVVVWFKWAPNNLMFTFVKEGTAKVIMRGGGFSRILMQWQGSGLDDYYNIGRVEDGFRPQHHLWGGLCFYGIWPFWDVFVYDFSWTNLNELGEVKQHRNETLDYILLKEDVYYVKLEDAEDMNMLPLTVELLLTMRVVNPRRAQFEVQDWLEAVLNRIGPSVRDMIAQDSYESHIGGHENQQVQRKGKKALGENIYNREQDTIREFQEEYGVLLREIEVRNIDPPSQYRDASLKKWMAERERERIQIEAEAEKYRIATAYGAVADQGELGKLIRALEALEKSPEQGAKWVLPIGGMSEILSQAFPGTNPDQLSSQQVLDAIREGIKGVTSSSDSS